MLKVLCFANAYAGKPQAFWKNIIFSYKSKINIFDSYGKKTVAKDKYVPSNLKLETNCKTRWLSYNDLGMHVCQQSW